MKDNSDQEPDTHYVLNQRCTLYRMALQTIADNNVNATSVQDNLRRVRIIAKLALDAGDSE